MTDKTQPLTASQLADALDAFNNASIGALHTNYSPSTSSFEVVGAIAQGFAEIASHLRQSEQVVAVMEPRGLFEVQFSDGTTHTTPAYILQHIAELKHYFEVQGIESWSIEGIGTAATPRSSPLINLESTVTTPGLKGSKSVPFKLEVEDDGSYTIKFKGEDAIFEHNPRQSKEVRDFHPDTQVGEPLSREGAENFMLRLQAMTKTVTMADWEARGLMLMANGGKDKLAHFGTSSNLGPPRAHELEADVAWCALLNPKNVVAFVLYILNLRRDFEELQFRMDSLDK